MKKTLIITALVAVLSATAVTAQQLPKIDKAMVEREIAKSDADIAHPKRSLRGYTWMDRGKMLYESTIAPVRGLFDGMAEADVEKVYGKGEDKGVIDSGVFAGSKVIDYPNFTLYFKKPQAAAYRLFYWEQKLFIKGASLEGATQAYLKVLEFDDTKGTADEVAKALKEIGNRYMVEANNYQDIHDFPKAADMCLASYEISALPIINKPDYKTLYIAGYLYASSGDYEKGAKYLKIAADNGQTTNGDTYYYIAYCCDMLKDKKMAQAALEDGVAKFPNNTKMVEMLASIYANGDNAEEHLEFVEKAANTFNKADLWSAVGRVYDKSGNVDKAVEAFIKAIEQNPSDYITNFNIGLMYVKQGAELSKEVNAKDYASQNDYNKANAGVLDFYIKALPYLEKAIEIHPSEKSYITFTRDILAHLRERDKEYLNKYNKYVDMAKAME